LLASSQLSNTHVTLYKKPQEKVINMASPTDIRKGRVLVYQGAPHLVLEMQHRTQGRQAGFVQTTLRNLQSGSTTTTKFRSTDNVEFMHTTTQKLEFSYKDTEGHHFMDLETYEDTVLSSDMIGEDDCFLVEGNTYDILLVDGEAIRLELPASVEATVTEAPEALRGDTAGNVLKPVTISSGITVQVPLFIKKDDTIKISTSDRSYLGRVN
jgi:elongation factor P